ncbi:hypothetical protein A2U01_0046138, partial [Trifolium medium]|nr:hypothetical protein [Trifolium medium]
MGNQGQNSNQGATYSEYTTKKTITHGRGHDSLSEDGSKQFGNHKDKSRDIRQEP